MKTLLIAVILMTITGCSDATRAGFRALGQKHRVTLYSGGVKVGEWVTSGKVENEASSDGYYFNDDATKRLVGVSGTVVIEVLP